MTQRKTSRYRCLLDRMTRARSPFTGDALYSSRIQVDWKHINVTKRSAGRRVASQRQKKQFHLRPRVSRCVTSRFAGSTHSTPSRSVSFEPDKTNAGRSVDVQNKRLREKSARFQNRLTWRNRRRRDMRYRNINGLSVMCSCGEPQGPHPSLWSLHHNQIYTYLYRRPPWNVRVTRQTTWRHLDKL